MEISEGDKLFSQILSTLEHVVSTLSGSIYKNRSGLKS